jgi:hypothetical protein
VVSQQPVPTVQNHFIAGLKTEFTGLNFPENAATDTQNCVYTLTGDVNRRGGLNFEANNVINNINAQAVARSSYRWKNVGGDGQTQMLVQQVGSILYFFVNSVATISNPLSTQLLNTTINLNSYQAIGNTDNISQIEAQYADGNGFLIVFHKSTDPLLITFNPLNSTFTTVPISLTIRDLAGIPEPGVADNFRPTSLTIEHTYNLTNQGWTQGAGWSGNGTCNNNYPGGGIGGNPIGASWTIAITSQVNTTSVVLGSQLKIQFQGINPGGFTETVTVIGNVSAYSATTPGTVTITITSCDHPQDSPGIYSGGTAFFSPNEACTLFLVNQGFINTWNSVLHNFPSNSDIWWLYKDNTGTFNPGSTSASVQQNIGAAPKGTYILNAFRQQRSAASGIAGITDVITNTRPSTGTWFQGRIFYSGVNSSAQPQGDEPYYTWTENIYFSQIIQNPPDFGKCYQVNDPTSQNLFSILPSDGGVITIQGSGAIYKLFALRFGLLVFAANGVWFIGGSQGVGFAANDYTITKISSIEAISGTSFIDVQGFPMFWNAEGVYQVVPSAQPGSAHSPDIQLDVQNMTVGTILGYYANIPLPSKFYARGDYDQISYVVQWCFKNTQETSIVDRYNYDTILNYNVVTKAFYVYTLPSSPTIYDVKWVQSPGGTLSPQPVFKYITATSTLGLTFSEENDFTRWLDFFNLDNIGQNYNSYFVTGYTLPGQGLRKIQIPYVFMFSRNPVGTNSYIIRAIWDFAGSGNLGVIDNLSGKWSTRQVITNNQTDFQMVYRKIRLRGRGLAVQIRVDSVQGRPFDIMGWSVWNEVNPGI